MTIRNAKLGTVMRRYLLLPSRNMGVQAICAEATATDETSSSSGRARCMVRARSHRAPRPDARPRRLLIGPHAHTHSRPHEKQITITNRTRNLSHDCAGEYTKVLLSLFHYAASLLRLYYRSRFFHLIVFRIPAIVLSVTKLCHCYRQIEVNGKSKLYVCFTIEHKFYHDYIEDRSVTRNVNNFLLFLPKFRIIQHCGHLDKPIDKCIVSSYSFVLLCLM